MDINIVLGILGFVTQFIGLAIGGVWALSRMESRMSSQVTKNRDDIHNELDRMRREVGEAVAAMRQKINDVELWTRDTFIRRDSFFELMRRGEKLMDSQFATITAQFEKVDVRFGKVDEKLDRIVERRAD